MSVVNNQNLGGDRKGNVESYSGFRILAEKTDLQNMEQFRWHKTDFDYVKIILRQLKIMSHNNRQYEPETLKVTI